MKNNKWNLWVALAAAIVSTNVNDRAFAEEKVSMNGRNEISAGYLRMFGINGTYSSPTHPVVFSEEFGFAQQLGLPPHSSDFPNPHTLWRTPRRDPDYREYTESESSRSALHDENSASGFQVTYRRTIAGFYGERVNVGFFTAISWIYTEFSQSTIRTDTLRQGYSYARKLAAGEAIPYDPCKQERTTAHTVVFDQMTELNLFIGQVGPFMEIIIPYVPRASLALSGGIAVGLADSMYSWQQNANGFRTKGSGSEFHALPGGYASADVRFAITERFGLSVGAQYLTLGSFLHEQAHIDLSSLWTIGAKLSYQF